MNIKDDWRKVKSVLEHGQASTVYCSIATVNPDGTPHITPVGYKPIAYPVMMDGMWPEHAMMRQDYPENVSLGTELVLPARAGHTERALLWQLLA